VLNDFPFAIYWTIAQCVKYNNKVTDLSKRVLFNARCYPISKILDRSIGYVDLDYILLKYKQHACKEDNKDNYVVLSI
jgi:hypothetical protein